MLACSKEYYVAHVAKSDYDTLKKLGYIGYKKDIALFRSWFNLHYGREPSALNMVLVADNAAAIISAMEESMGLGIIVSHLISKQIEDGSMVTIGSSGEKLRNTIACVRFKDKKMTLTETAFRHHFLGEIQRISSLQTDG